MAEITVTLRQILDAYPCYDPREKRLLPADHDLDAPITFGEIAEKASPDDLIWCFTYALPGHEALKRHFAVDCAERVRHLITDPRSLNALVIARHHAMGEATDAELAAAWDAAWDAAKAAAWDAAWYAAEAAAGNAAWYAAEAAAGNAAKAAAWDAAWDAAKAAAWYAAKAAAGNAAEAAERAWQAERIVQLTEAGEWSPIIQDL